MTREQPYMPKTILIVEDDDLLRDLTAESLSSLYAVAVTLLRKC